MSLCSRTHARELALKLKRSNFSLMPSGEPWPKPWSSCCLAPMSWSSCFSTSFFIYKAVELGAQN